MEMSVLNFHFRESGVSASFGEMLLLIAIHFHSNQTSAIAELVSSMLGMKVHFLLFILMMLFTLLNHSHYRRSVTDHVSRFGPRLLTDTQHSTLNTQCI